MNEQLDLCHVSLIDSVQVDVKRAEVEVVLSVEQLEQGVLRQGAALEDVDVGDHVVCLVEQLDLVCLHFTVKLFKAVVGDVLENGIGVVQEVELVLMAEDELLQLRREDVRVPEPAEVDVHSVNQPSVCLFVVRVSLFLSLDSGVAKHVDKGRFPLAVEHLGHDPAAVGCHLNVVRTVPFKVVEPKGTVLCVLFLEATLTLVIEEEEEVAGFFSELLRDFLLREGSIQPCPYLSLETQLLVRGESLDEEEIAFTEVFGPFLVGDLNIFFCRRLGLGIEDVFVFEQLLRILSVEPWELLEVVVFIFRC
mmetsp:Transcript_5487/g.8567  ORF Transcript_5487/g.8567 Transcript_5487/m.8567 type:complete len:307 (-) Transcript_5487:2671-3591(-)